MDPNDDARIRGLEVKLTELIARRRAMDDVIKLLQQRLTALESAS